MLYFNQSLKKNAGSGFGNMCFCSLPFPLSLWQKGVVHWVTQRGVGDLFSFTGFKVATVCWNAASFWQEGHSRNVRLHCFPRLQSPGNFFFLFFVLLFHDFQQKIVLFPHSWARFPSSQLSLLHGLKCLRILFVSSATSRDCDIQAFSTETNGNQHLCKKQNEADADWVWGTMSINVGFLFTFWPRCFLAPQLRLVAALNELFSEVLSACWKWSAQRRSAWLTGVKLLRQVSY